MSLARSIRSAMIRRYADPLRRERERQQAEAARQKSGRPHQVLYFHQIDDPYSQLAVQAIAPLLDRFEIELIPKLVAAPTPIAIHEQTLWAQWARRDAAAIAPFHGLHYAELHGAEDPKQLALARRLLLTAEPPRAFAALAIEINAALHQGDMGSLQALVADQPLPDAAQAEQKLSAHFKLRHRLGHYLGGMFYYEGEWYWGIDRLHYLEARLSALGARRRAAPAGNSVVRRQLEAPTTDIGDRRLQLEFFPSLRSPYTQLSYARVAALCQRYPIDLQVRPVLPMMMRGVKADRRKGRYIIQDTKREAERLGVAFGKVWDPFGKPILRAYSLFPWARDQGRGFEYLQAYSEAVWSQGVNAHQLDGLRLIVERAGLRWQQAEPHLDNNDWQPEMEANVEAMIAAGSWGVPTLRLGAQQGEPAFTVWGQDRIWLIEAEILRRLALPPA